MHTQSREVAFRVLERVEKTGSFADALLNYELQHSGLKAPRDRALTTELVYGTIRMNQRLDHVISSMLNSRSMSEVDPRLRILLRLGAYQILFMDRIPPHAAINETVEMAKTHAGEKQAGFVNAILRRILENPKAAGSVVGVADEEARVSILHSHPEWIVRRLAARYGIKQAAAICAANNIPAPVALRVNTMKLDPDMVLRSMSRKMGNIRPSTRLPETILLREAGNPALIKEVMDGFALVQSESSQMVPFLVAPGRGERVLDLCAGVGNKTAGLAMLSNERAFLFANDVDPHKLESLGANFACLGLHPPRILCSDSTAGGPFKPGTVFNKILIDAPCSGTGVMRKRPEIRWRLKESDIPALVSLQLSLLASAAGLVADDGALVYSTCSILEDENELVINRFLEDGVFELEDPTPILPQPLRAYVSGGFFKTLPDADGLEGFFVARLKRRK
jgi:16S rRNA (cytosine967-C5)-methyltransferase